MDMGLWCRASRGEQTACENAVLDMQALLGPKKDDYQRTKPSESLATPSSPFPTCAVARARKSLKRWSVYVNGYWQGSGRGRVGAKMGVISVSQTRLYSQFNL